MYAIILLIMILKAQKLSANVLQLMWATTQGFTLNSLIPVSYTHLDVYKRQLGTQTGTVYKRNSQTHNS